MKKDTSNKSDEAKNDGDDATDVVRCRKPPYQ